MIHIKFNFCFIELGGLLHKGNCNGLEKYKFTFYFALLTQQDDFAELLLNWNLQGMLMTLYYGILIMSLVMILRNGEQTGTDTHF
jgi:hypothetical protein